MSRVIKAEDAGRAQVLRRVYVRLGDGSLLVVGEVVECDRGVLILRRVILPGGEQSRGDREPGR